MHDIPSNVTLYVTSSGRRSGAHPTFSRSNVTCFRCGEAGHYRAVCLTYKTRMCAHAATCRDPDRCDFAHSFEELRRPLEAKCVRVVAQGGSICVLGCGRKGHTFRNCPFSAGS